MRLLSRPARGIRIAVYERDKLPRSQPWKSHWVKDTLDPRSSGILLLWICTVMNSYDTEGFVEGTSDFQDFEFRS